MKDAAMFMPFTGELGWELMRWQAWVRKMCRDYKDKLVFCRKGSEYLYSDYKARVIGLSAELGRPDCWGNDEFYLNDTEAAAFNRYRNLAGYDQYIPNEAICRGNVQQEFIRFGAENTNKRDIAIHARWDKRAKDRNWSVDKWDKLIGLLRGFRMVTIGSKDAALPIKGAEDRRGVPLNELANILYNCKLCIGPSSGPLHYAALCGCPVLVWTDKKNWAVGPSRATNRTRYCRDWNPLHVKTYVIDDYDYNPDPKIIKETILKESHQLGLDGLK